MSILVRGNCYTSAQYHTESTRFTHMPIFSRTFIAIKNEICVVVRAGARVRGYTQRRVLAGCGDFDNDVTGARAREAIETVRGPTRGALDVVATRRYMDAKARVLIDRKLTVSQPMTV